MPATYAKLVKVLTEVTTCLKLHHDYMKERDILPVKLKFQYNEVFEKIRNLNLKPYVEQKRRKKLADVLKVSELEDDVELIFSASATKKPDGDEYADDAKIDDDSWSTSGMSSIVEIERISPKKEKEDNSNEDKDDPMYDPNSEKQEEKKTPPLISPGAALEMKTNLAKLQKEVDEFSVPDPVVDALEAKDFLTDNIKKPYQCQACLRGYSSFPKLKRHIKQVHRPFTCPVCFQEFSATTSRKTHMLIHTGDKPYTCAVCHMSFRQSNTMKDHMKTHTGEKPYQCADCGTCFARRYSLNLHRRRLHTGERPFHCEHCPSKFSSSSELLRHTRTHTGEKPYLCDICTSRFSQTTDLHRHVAKHHSGNDQLMYEISERR